MGGTVGVSVFAAAVLDLAGVAGVVLAGAPGDGCFLSFGTFDLSISAIVKNSLIHSGRRKRANTRSDSTEVCPLKTGG